MSQDESWPSGNDPVKRHVHCGVFRVKGWGKVSFEVGLLSGILAWQEENSASAEEAAVYFLTTQSGVWSQWIDDSAREKLSKFIK